MAEKVQVGTVRPVSGSPFAGTVRWPAHRRETRPWRQAARGGTAEDRKLSQVAVGLPPAISSTSLQCPAELVLAMESGLREIAALDATHGQHLGALGSLLLRTESVASSKIEHVEAYVSDYARALYGVRSNPSAVSMAAATAALDTLIRSVDGGREVTLDNLLTCHRVLMAEDPQERGYAGRLREVQNWIGGSDFSPRNAVYVPPPAETVSGYMSDLVGFANRTDLPTLAQAAIAHAQFESVHPFTDGNGRVGRALVNTILRRRGVTTRVVVPIASALVAHRDRYFDLLEDYRAGDPAPIVAAFAVAAGVAAHESRESAERFARFPAQWRDAVGRVRAGSATARLLDRLADAPLFSADEAEQLVGGAAPAAVYGALDRLVEAGVLRPLTQRKRNQVWGVVSLLEELDDLGARIAAASRNTWAP